MQSNLSIDYLFSNISKMNIDLKDKNALVCGSSKGIGKAAAIEIAKLGANVTLVSRSANAMGFVLDELDSSKGQQHDYLVADFSDSTDLRKKILGLTSLKTIHILVNNTGGPKSGPVSMASSDAFEQAFHNHVVCNHLLTKAVLKGMKESGYGRIINIISTSVKEPLNDLGVSNTIRAAVANWAKSIANEVGQFGVTVNNVLPGFTNTGRLQSILKYRAEQAGIDTATQQKNMEDSVALNRFAHPSEIGSVIAFLASPAASYIHGTNITVDGGRTKSL